MDRLSRRDFLKLWGSLTPLLFAPHAGPPFALTPAARGQPPNILVLVFDAMSARHLSLYGYKRPTTPNLEALASRAIVYHSHFSAGNYTPTGTASMLTGMYPWKHRAINVYSLVKRELAGANLFARLGESYGRFAFSQNLQSDVLLRQFRGDLDTHIPATSFGEAQFQTLLSQSLPADQSMGFHALDHFLLRSDGPPGALFTRYLDALARGAQLQSEEGLEGYPYGRPDNMFYQYHNPTVYAGLRELILTMAEVPAPFFGYLHLYAPHSPYAPRKDFVDTLGDLHTAFKPVHRLSTNHLKKAELDALRKRYDEFVAEVDAEVGLLMRALEAAGLLEHTYVFLTSDHGELFERGEYDHFTPLMYDGVLHIPLVVLEPGREKRMDVHTPTSNVDLSPTILGLAGKQPPESLDGRRLPGLGGDADPERAVFAVEAKENSAFSPLTRASIALIKGPYKLIYYLGYPRYRDVFELYHLEEDPEERKDLFGRDPGTARRMQEELLENLQVSNEPYLRSGY